MFEKIRILLWQFFIVVVILCVPHSARAGEVGTTPEGNVIYLFRCPGSVSYNHVQGIKIDWPNHIDSGGLEWDIGPGNNDGETPLITTRFKDKSRQGQLLICKYDILHNGDPGKGTVEYRYKVHRKIISCIGANLGEFKCILESDGGGQSSSSATSATSSEPAEKCIGLGCETQPNPDKCIGRGCDEKNLGTKETPLKMKNLSEEP